MMEAPLSPALSSLAFIGWEHQGLNERLILCVLAFKKPPHILYILINFNSQEIKWLRLILFVLKLQYLKILQK